MNWLFFQECGVFMTACWHYARLCMNFWLAVIFAVHCGDAGGGKSHSRIEKLVWTVQYLKARYSDDRYLLILMHKLFTIYSSYSRLVLKPQFYSISYLLLWKYHFVLFHLYLVTYLLLSTGLVYSKEEWETEWANVLRLASSAPRGGQESGQEEGNEGGQSKEKIQTKSDTNSDISAASKRLSNGWSDLGWPC